nr:MAG TPA: hypothetical protein [Caudoviricetes sp.]
MIPRLLSTVYHTLITKKNKNPVINFKVLQAKCTEKTKEVMSLVF